MNKDVFQNDEYISWLNTFTKTYHSFSNIMMIYNRLPKEDRENIDKLELLYAGIKEYAEKNFLYPNESSFNNYYLLKSEDNIYEIGYANGKNIAFYCKKINPIDDDNIIDFNDIKNNTPRPETSLYKTKLNKLASFINELIELNVPVKAISDTTGNVLNKTLKKKYKGGNYEIK